MKSSFSMVLYKKVKIQLLWPYVAKNDFGWGFFAKTCIVLGYGTIALEILGFGLGISDCRNVKWSLKLYDVAFPEEKVSHE